ncbi:MAG TPA: hypothetical protein VEA15_03735 [Caulobacteraceae bacterium]|nr:hypothetical protein [Caulobacteraceae bacterium]
MPDPERSWSRSKAIAGGLVVVGVFGFIVLVRVLGSGRETPVTPDPPPAKAAQPAPLAQPPLPLPPPPLGRADLLAAVDAAASDYAAGRPSTAAAEALAGRRFRIAIPFGCAGPSADAAESWASWTPGEDGATVRVRVRPEDWKETAFVRELGGGDAFEAVEGFWIPRPWSDSEDCPAVVADPLQPGRVAPAPQTVGLAVLFESGGSRVRQRAGRPYEVTVKAPQPDATTDPAMRGYRVILEGRVGAFPDAAPIRCRASGPDERPVCLVAAEVERVAIRDPRSGQELGEWGGS